MLLLVLTLAFGFLLGMAVDDTLWKRKGRKHGMPVVVVSVDPDAAVEKATALLHEAGSGFSDLSDNKPGATFSGVIVKGQGLVCIPETSPAVAAVQCWAAASQCEALEEHLRQYNRNDAPGRRQTMTRGVDPTPTARR